MSLFAYVQLFNHPRHVAPKRTHRLHTFLVLSGLSGCLSVHHVPVLRTDYRHVLRYPVRIPFAGSALRFRFSNLTGTEPVTLSKVFVGHTPITFGGAISVTLQPGNEVESDAISYAVHRGDTVDVSMYLADYTQMNSGTLITGPLSKGFYAYGDFAEAAAHKLIRHIPSTYDHEEQY
jgi:hypothetical protein